MTISFDDTASTYYLDDMTITNKYHGRCSVCSCSVPAKSGTATKTSSGWQVRCPAHVGEAVAARPQSSTAGRYRMGSGRGSAASVAGYSSYCTDRPSCRCYDCAS